MKVRTKMILDVPLRENDRTREAYGLFNFLEDNDMLLDYLDQKADEYLQSGKQSRNTYLTDSEMFIESFEYNGKKYYIYTTPRNSYRRYFLELPAIYDDENFIWKDDIRNGTKTTTIEDSIFDFECIYRADGSTRIDVKYNECENTHRNRVSIATFEIEDSNNYEIKKAITDWKKCFKSKIAAA